MPGFRLTKAAKADMLGIGRYTRHRWGRDQMRRYVGGIDARFHDLASQPELGRVYLELPPYRRLMCGKHALFYRVTEDATVLVVRVLHVRMLPELHLPGSEDDDG